MNCLVVSATQFEIEPLLPMLLEAPVPEGGCPEPKLLDGEQFDVLITGVGLTACAFELGRTLAKRDYKSAMQLGIGGSFGESPPIGSVVHVTEEQFGDCGVQTEDGFFDLFDMNLLPTDGETALFERRKLINRTPLSLPGLPNLAQVHGISVNTVLGEEQRIQQISEKYQPDVVSMEGAAFFYACLRQQIPFAQIRAISDRVVPRKQSTWKISEAVHALAETTARLLTIS